MRWRCADDQKQIPTLQEFFTFKIPSIEGVGPYEDFYSLKFAGPPDAQNPNGTKLPWPHIHADYFNAEDHADLVSRCINQEQGGISKACS